MANPTDHYKLSGLDVHGTIWQEAADATARLALSLVALDQGKDVLQLDTGHVYKLIVDTGVNEAASWVDISASGTGGSGDVTGPASSTDNNPAVFDGTTGKIIKNVAKPIAVAHLSDGVDGELITWDASGVAATVAAGTATQVLTSNGTGAAPTFQAAGGGAVMFLPFGGNFQATVAGYHYSFDSESPWSAVQVAVHQGVLADPVLPASNVVFVAPRAGTVTDVACWYRVGTGTVGGVIEIYKHTWTSGSASVTSSQLGTDLVVATAGDVTFRYDVSTTFSSANTFSAGDLISMYFKANTDETGSLWFQGTLAMEFS